MPKSVVNTVWVTTELVGLPSSTYYLQLLQISNQIHIIFNPENCGLLGYYSASSGHFLPTFRTDRFVPKGR